MKWISYHAREAEGKYLFRFLTLDQLTKFLDTGDIWLSRVNAFGDKMECVLINDLERVKPDFKSLEKRKRRTLASCWHLADKESVAMWDAYSKTEMERRVCALRFKRRELIKLFKSGSTNSLGGEIKRKIYGKVVYRDLLSFDGLGSMKVKFHSFRKEAAFRYEAEFRFVIQLTREFEQSGFDYPLGSPVDLPFKILINPLLESQHYRRLVDSLSKGPHSKKVKESKLAKWLKPDLW